ncbi:MAG TPA: hypothetical protein VHE55_06055 [Fimbriimonadaceae bacterium]|nr:hypothetical protein [Fimbriimonadaceae bacterium]
MSGGDANLVTATWWLAGATVVLVLATFILVLTGIRQLKWMQVHSEHLSKLAGQTGKIAEAAKTTAESGKTSAYAAWSAVATVNRARLKVTDTSFGEIDYGGKHPNGWATITVSNIGPTTAKECHFSIYQKESDDSWPPTKIASDTSADWLVMHAGTTARLVFQQVVEPNKIGLYFEVTYKDEFGMGHALRWAAWRSSDGGTEAVPVAGWDCDS